MSQSRQVTGTVLHADGSPIRAMDIRAFHRRVGGEVPLGSQVTNVHGQYAIAYQQPAGISKIDLFVRAYDAQQAVVAVSSLVTGAGDHEALDLTVTDQRFRGPSEFAKASDTLAPLLAGLQLDQLDANDVALMVRNTAIPRESVTAWIASKRLADRTKVDPESLYALVRVESTASLPRLLRRSPARLLTSLTSAAYSNTSHRPPARARKRPWCGFGSSSSS
jgi:hypothetical protein